MPFTDELTRLTDEAHSQAERSTFIAELLGGEHSTREYTRLIQQYLPLYSALESAIRILRDEQPVGAFFDPNLERAPRIAHDLTQLGVDPAEHTPLPTTTAYVERLIRHVEQRDTTRLLAHHYLRYLGDLSGGQIIGRLVQRHYDVPDSALTVWDFSDVGKTKLYKDAYRARLNTEICGEQQAAFIDECLQGYNFARDLFDDLAAAPAR